MTKPPRFDLPDLRLFVAVADAGSLSQGAARLPLALSAASARLRQLESRFGLPLFTRHASGVALTAGGALFLDHARRLCRAADEAQAAMDALTDNRRTTLTLWANTTANATLPAMLGRFLADHPMLDIRLEERPSREVMRAVAAGEADLGVIDTDYQPDGLTTLPFRRDRLVAIVPPGHPLAGRQTTTFRNVLASPMIGLPEGSAIQGFLEKMARLAGLDMRVRARAPNFAAIAQLVVEGAGLAILPEAAARRYREPMGLTVLALADNWATRDMQVCVRKLDELPLYARKLAAWLAGVRG